MGWAVRVELTTSRATIWRPNQLGHTHHMACQERLELPTYCLEGSCSIQLSYWRILWSQRWESNPQLLIGSQMFCH